MSDNDVALVYPFIYIQAKNITCSYCNTKSNDTGVLLQCGHSLHSKCLEKIFMREFGDELFFVSFDKSKIWNFLENKKYGTLMLGTAETTGIIHCPECRNNYSVLSPIYREFGVPKK